MSRLQGVDVLRGLAVVLVVLHHIHLRFRLNHYEVGHLMPEPLAQVLFRTGHYSVIAFFVISGFLITALALRRWNTLDRIPLRQFYHLRAARILPCLLLLLLALSILHGAGASDFLINPERATLGRALGAALTFHINWLEGHHGYLPGNWDVLWSLSIEETFYVFFPLLCLLVRHEGGMLIGLLALIVIGPFNRVALMDQDPWDEYSYLSCMDGIAFGCIAAVIGARVSLSRQALRATLISGIAAVLLIVIFRKTTVALGLTATGLNITVLELGMALILLALASGLDGATPLKGTALLRLVGRCSYEIYLTHMFVVFGAMHLFKALFGSMTASPGIYLITYAAVLAGSIIFGYVVARWFSEPVNRALRA